MSTASAGCSAGSRPGWGPAALVEVVEVELSASDQAALHRSAAAVEEVIGVIERNREQIDSRLPSLR